jgi:hypothetical protein
MMPRIAVLERVMHFDRRYCSLGHHFAGYMLDLSNIQRAFILFADSSGKSNIPKTSLMQGVKCITRSKPPTSFGVVDQCSTSL